MPRDTQIQPNRQVPTKQQDTFRYSTPDMKVVARPVDATTPPLAHYQQPDIPNLMRGLSTSGMENADRNARLLMNAIGGMGEALHTYAGVKKEQNKEDMNNGYYNALKGQGLTPEANFYEQMGHSLYKGEAASVDYERAVTEAYADFGHTAKPEEWNQKLNEIRSTYMSGKDNFFMEGFHDRSRSIDSKFTTQYYTDQLKQRKEETINAIAVTASQDVGTILKTHGSNKEAVANGLRDYLTGMQENGGSLNKQEMSELFVKIVGERAEATASPWLLDFTKLKDKNGGTKLSDTLLMETINNYTSKAEAKQMHLENKALAAASKAEHYQEKAAMRVMSDMVLAGKSFDEIMATPEGHAALRSMSPSSILSFKNADDRETTALNYNSSTYLKLLNDAGRGELNEVELMKAYQQDKTISLTDSKSIASTQAAVTKGKTEATYAGLASKAPEENAKLAVGTMLNERLGPEGSQYIPTPVKNNIIATTIPEMNDKLEAIQRRAMERNNGIFTAKEKMNDQEYKKDVDNLLKETMSSLETKLKPYSVEAPSISSATPSSSKDAQPVSKSKQKYHGKSSVDIINGEGLHKLNVVDRYAKLIKMEDDGLIDDDQRKEILNTLYGK